MAGTKRTKPHTKNVFRDQIFLATDYNEFTNEIPFVGDILKLEPIFTAAEIQANKDLAGTSEQSDRLDAQNFNHILTWHLGSKVEIWLCQYFYH